jgi:transglutaminase-like putative cysteine protease
VLRDGSDASRGGPVAVALDPTHDRRAEGGYLTVAVGRDYADVAPTSGTFEGTCQGVLSARKRLSPATALTTRTTR